MNLIDRIYKRGHWTGEVFEARIIGDAELALIKAVVEAANAASAARGHHFDDDRLLDDLREALSRLEN